MIIDKELMVSNNQAISANGANYSTNAIDLSVARNIAKGEPLYLVVVVTELFAGTGTTMQIRVITATHENLTTNQVILVQTPALAKATLTKGRVPIVIALPPLPAAGGAQRYLGVDFRTDQTFEDTGRITAFVGIGPQTN